MQIYQIQICHNFFGMSFTDEAISAFFIFCLLMTELTR